MKLRDDPLVDPIEHSFEAKAFEMKLKVFPFALGQERLMNPDPQVAKQQRDHHERQPKMRVSRAGVNPSLTHLAITGLDAEPLPITLANLGRGAAHTPGPEEQFLLGPLAVLAILVRAIGHADLDRHLARFVLQRMRIPSGRLPFDLAQSGRRTSLPSQRHQGIPHVPVQLDPLRRSPLPRDSR